MDQEFVIHEAQEILKLIESMNAIRKNVNEFDENKLIGTIDDCLENVNQLMMKCDEIDDESLSEEFIKSLEENIEE